MAVAKVQVQFKGAAKPHNFAVFLQPLMENEIKFKVLGQPTYRRRGEQNQKMGLTTSVPASVTDGQLVNWTSLSFSILFDTVPLRADDVVAVKHHNGAVSVRVNDQPACEFMLHCPHSQTFYLLVSRPADGHSSVSLCNFSLITEVSSSPPVSQIATIQQREPAEPKRLVPPTCCSLCREATPTVMVVPCGHVVACRPCWSRYLLANDDNANIRSSGAPCVVCRGPAARTVQLLLVEGADGELGRCLACSATLCHDRLAVANPCGHAIACFDCVERLNGRRKLGLGSLNCSKCRVVSRRFYKAHYT